MRLFPRTIVGRTVLVLLAGLIVSHLVSIFIYSDDRRSALMASGGRQAAERVASVYLDLDRAVPSERPAIIRSRWQPMFAMSWTRDSVLAAVGENGWRAHMVRSAIEDYLPEVDEDMIHVAFRHLEDARFGLAEGDPILTMHRHMGRDLTGEGDRGHRHFNRVSRRWHHDRVLSVSIPLGDGSWFNVATPMTRLRSQWWPGVFGPIVLTSITVILFSVWAVRRSAKPISLFAQAAERLGRDVNAPPLPETGPREVAAASRAFNDMQRKLQSFIRDRTEMLAAISHDLRTPITRLRLRAELIEDEEQQGKMLADLEQMEQMIAATLAFARDESADEASIRFDLAAMLQSLADDISDTGGRATYEGPDKLEWVGRPGAMKRALQNLADNAVKYGGGVDITMDENGESLVIRFADDGPGIPENQRVRVFDPFYRIDPSRNRDTGGAGLGLAVVRSVIRAHGGEVGFSDDGGRFAVVITLSNGSVA